MLGLMRVRGVQGGSKNIKYQRGEEHLNLIWKDVDWAEE